MWLHNHDLLAVIETWWDNLHDWNVVTDGYMLVWKDRPARIDGGVALYMRDQLECIQGWKKNELRAYG